MYQLSKYTSISNYLFSLGAHIGHLNVDSYDDVCYFILGTRCYFTVFDTKKTIPLSKNAIIFSEHTINNFGFSLFCYSNIRLINSHIKNFLAYRINECNQSFSYMNWAPGCVTNYRSVFLRLVKILFRSAYIHWLANKNTISSNILSYSFHRKNYMNKLITYFLNKSINIKKVNHFFVRYRSFLLKNKLSRINEKFDSLNLFVQSLPKRMNPSFAKHKKLITRPKLTNITTSVHPNPINKLTWLRVIRHFTTKSVYKLHNTYSAYSLLKIAKTFSKIITNNPNHYSKIRLLFMYCIFYIRSATLRKFSSGSLFNKAVLFIDHFVSGIRSRNKGKKKKLIIGRRSNEFKLLNIFRKVLFSHRTLYSGFVHPLHKKYKYRSAWYYNKSKYGHLRNTKYVDRHAAYYYRSKHILLNRAYRNRNVSYRSRQKYILNRLYRRNSLYNNKLWDIRSWRYRNRNISDSIESKREFIKYVPMYKLSFIDNVNYIKSNNDIESIKYHNTRNRRDRSSLYIKKSHEMKHTRTMPSDSPYSGRNNEHESRHFSYGYGSLKRKKFTRPKPIFNLVDQLLKLRIKPIKLNSTSKENKILSFLHSMKRKKSQSIESVIKMHKLWYSKIRLITKLFRIKKYRRNIQRFYSKYRKAIRRIGKWLVHDENNYYGKSKYKTKSLFSVYNNWAGRLQSSYLHYSNHSYSNKYNRHNTNIKIAESKSSNFKGDNKSIRNTYANTSNIRGNIRKDNAGDHYYHMRRKENVQHNIDNSNNNKKTHIYSYYGNSTLYKKHSHKMINELINEKTNILGSTHMYRSVYKNLKNSISYKNNLFKYRLKRINKVIINSLSRNNIFENKHSDCNINYRDNENTISNPNKFSMYSRRINNKYRGDNRTYYSGRNYYVGRVIRPRFTSYAKLNTHNTCNYHINILSYSKKSKHYIHGKNDFYNMHADNNINNTISYSKMVIGSSHSNNTNVNTVPRNNKNKKVSSFMYNNDINNPVYYNAKKVTNFNSIKVVHDKNYDNRHTIMHGSNYNNMTNSMSKYSNNNSMRGNNNIKRSPNGNNNSYTNKITSQALKYVHGNDYEYGKDRKYVYKGRKTDYNDKIRKILYYKKQSLKNKYDFDKNDTMRYYKYGHGIMYDKNYNRLFYLDRNKNNSYVARSFNDFRKATKLALVDDNIMKIKLPYGFKKKLLKFKRKGYLYKLRYSREWNMLNYILDILYWNKYSFSRYRNKKRKKSVITNVSRSNNNNDYVIADYFRIDDAITNKSSIHSRNAWTKFSIDKINVFRKIPSFLSLFIRLFYITKLKFVESRLDKLSPEESFRASFHRIKRFWRAIIFSKNFRKTANLPDCLILLNPSNSNAVVNDFLCIDIPIIGISDSNTNITQITYPIPSNDDSIILLIFYFSIFINACNSAISNRYLRFY